MEKGFIVPLILVRILDWEKRIQEMANGCS
jgi:hypothetical protein